MPNDAGGDFEAHRARLTGLAYRMLGSVAEAEDVVQDAYLRWHGLDRGTIENPGAFLSRVVTRLCLDVLKGARRSRELYVGPWLPEPVVAEAGFLASPEEHLDRDVSIALLLALERLSPLERAAFILKDVFDMEFAEIAAALGRSETGCRQLASRARAHLREARPRFDVEPGEGERIARAFFAASRSGDAAALRDILARDAVLRTDGGGRKPAALNPIFGAERIVRFYNGLWSKKAALPPLWSVWRRINAMPGVLSVEVDGTVQTTAFEIEAERIAAVYVTRNPDKLRHVLPLIPEAYRPSPEPAH